MLPRRAATRLRQLLIVGSLLATAAWATPVRTIDLNTANQAELEMVKGIGPQLSGRLLAERANRRFDSWKDFVDRMKGIGPSHAMRLSAAGLRIGGRAFRPDGPDQAGSGAMSGPASK